MEQIVLQILKEKGLRMSNLAAMLDTDQSNLSKRLKKDPKVSFIESIATALNVPISSFFPDQHPAEPAGILALGGKRFALVPLPTAAWNTLTRPSSGRLTPRTISSTREPIS